MILNMIPGIYLIFLIMNYKDISSLRDYLRASKPNVSINISSLWEYKKQSGTDDMFIAQENTTTHQQSRRDDMFIVTGNKTMQQQSGTDDMFIANVNTMISNKSRRDAMFIATESNIANDKSGADDMFITSEYAIKPHKSYRDEISNIPYISQQSISPDFGIPKNNNIFPWILKPINVSSLRDCQWDSVPSIFTNISALREFLKQSGTDDMFLAQRNTTTHHQSLGDDMFIAQENTTTHQQSRMDAIFIVKGNRTMQQQSRRDAMFITSKSNVTKEKSGTAAMFIANIITTTSNMSIRDETAYIPYFSEQPIFLDFGIPKNNNIFPWILKPINVSSLRDCQWDSVPSISTNISSLREFLKQSGTDDMFTYSINYGSPVRLKHKVRFYFSLPSSCLRVYGLRFLTSFGMTGGYIGKGKVKRCGCTAPFNLPPSPRKHCHSEWSLSGMRNLIVSFIKKFFIIQQITLFTNSPINQFTNLLFHQPTPFTYARIL